jgi:hypothetical protein
MERDSQKPGSWMKSKKTCYFVVLIIVAIVMQWFDRFTGMFPGFLMSLSGFVFGAQAIQDGSQALSKRK